MHEASTTHNYVGGAVLGHTFSSRAFFSLSSFACLVQSPSLTDKEPFHKHALLKFSLHKPVFLGMRLRHFLVSAQLGLKHLPTPRKMMFPAPGPCPKEEKKTGQRR